MSQPDQTVTLKPAGWVDAHGDFLYRFAFVRVRNAETAEELVQETLLAALSARHRFRGRSSERSWLTAILKRKVVDWIRVSVRRKETVEPLADTIAEGFFTTSGKWKTKPDEWATADPGHELTRAEFLEIFSKCLSKLPERLRQVFVLRYMDEKSSAGVCQDAGVTAANFWVMLHRSRLRLSRCLSLNWFGEDPRTPSKGRP